MEFTMLCILIAKAPANIILASDFDINGNVTHQSDCSDERCRAVSLDDVVVKELKTYSNKLWCHDKTFENNGLFKKNSQVSYEGGCQAAQRQAIIEEISALCPFPTKLPASAPAK